ncbi:MAG: signal peptidase I [Pseudoflavonifractor sp.]
MISKICNFLSTLILLVAIVVAGALVLPKVVGITPMGVLSGSMEPFYHVGSIVYVNTKVTADQIAEGDAITFTVGDDTVVTHRVVAIDQAAQTFTTKGDANETKDFAPVPFSTLVGRAGLSIPLLGTLVGFFATGKGIAVLCAIAVLLIVLFTIPALLKPDDTKNKKETH